MKFITILRKIKSLLLYIWRLKNEHLEKNEETLILKKW